MILDSYTRVFVNADEFDKTRAFYRTILNGSDGLIVEDVEHHDAPPDEPLS
ncbi:hypothetical protein HC231_06250 [Brenneria izadpanahii]|uniref:Glyoxalase n=1 Tax=Brenneria izadpanahii TaxID=2722756 RepID=A0ABX7UT72_9GAMM|nr:hypothetical protein [Brenneria izadpanahii]QTF07567.1 hypothetical protein HC231_06250 [Brenneria izadpanahii]